MASLRDVSHRVRAGEVPLRSYVRKAWRTTRRGLVRRPFGRTLLMAQTAAVMSVRSRGRIHVHHADGGFFYVGADGALGATEPTSPPLAIYEGILRDHFLRSYVPRPGDVVVELGTGTETIGLARLVGATGRVLAVEANPRVARVLRRVLQLNDLANTDVVETAVSDTVGEVEFVDEAADVSGFIGSSSTVPTVRVPTMLLDAVTADVERIDFLKVNIEGAELPALRAAGETLRRRTHAVVSCHDFKADRTGNEFFRTRDAVAGLLVAHGFTILPGAGEDEPPAYRDTLFASR